jgi:Vacuolar protein sorting-associated protein 26
VRPFEVRFPRLSLPDYVTYNGSTSGETIPIRLFLGGFELTPTFRDVNKKFSTRYYLNLVLIDEENRRYFKQQVRMLWAFHLFQVVEKHCTRKLLFLGYPRYAKVQLLSSVGISLICSLFSSRLELNYPCTLFYLLIWHTCFVSFSF